MYSCGATNSTTEEFSSDRCHRSKLFCAVASQSKACGTSLVKLHMLHRQRCPLSMKLANGLMYVLQRRHREMTWSGTTGIGSSTSCKDVYGWITSANGSFDFFKSECVVGTVFKVERMNLGGQLASGEGVTEDYNS